MSKYILPGVTTVLVLLATLIRLHHLDFESLFMDEILQSSFYTKSIGQIADAAAIQRQPPLDYWIGSFIFRINPSDFSLRLPSALFGVGTVWLIILLTQRALSGIPNKLSEYGRMAVTYTVGFLAATLPYAVYISQDLRPYSSAIFLFLLQLLIIDSILSRNDVGFGTYLALAIATFALLISRTLSPLVVLLTNSFVLIFLWGLDVKERGWLGSQKQKRIFFILFSFVSALPFYLPYLLNILSQERRYLRGNVGIVENWPVYEIPAAWEAQLEPLGIPHLLLLIIAVIYIALNLKKTGSLSLVSLLLLCGATVLHFVIFTMMTDYPFRPPYSIYIYPLALILGGVGAGIVIAFLEQRILQKQVLIASVTCLALTAIVPTLLSLTNFKNQRIKTDWRSLSYYINQLSDDNDLFISNTLSNSKHWDPGFFGSIRYAVAKNKRLVKLKDLTMDPSKILGKSLKPILVIFHYRGYYLTQASTVPVMPTPSRTAPIEIEDIKIHPDLQVIKLKSLSIISMKQDFHDTHKELHALIDHFIDSNIEGPYLNSLHLAAAALSVGSEHSKDHSSAVLPLLE